VRLALAAGALIALAAPAAAGAATITAGPGPVSYQNPNVEIDAGEAVSFMNLDLTAPHDVTSVDVGAGAQPLFASATVGFLTTVPVTGAEALDAGRYDFLCSIHTFMTGSITVRGSGGGGGGGTPTLNLSALETDLGKVKRSGKLELRTRLDESATVRVSASTPKGVKFAAGSAKAGKGIDKLSAKLTSKGKRLVASAKKVKLEVSGRATDADGNSSKSTVKLTLD